jgi:hypothetical protein
MTLDELLAMSPLVPLRVYAQVMGLAEGTARQRANNDALGMDLVQFGGLGTTRYVYRDDLAKLAFRYDVPQLATA